MFRLSWPRILQQQAIDLDYHRIEEKWMVDSIRRMEKNWNFVENFFFILND